jgi:hypothetical protein
MKILTALLGVAIALLMAALMHQHARLDELHASLATAAQDRDGLRDDLRQLRALVADLQKRPAAATPGVAREGNRSDPAAPGADAAPKPPAPRPGVTVAAPAGWGKNGSKSDAYVVGVDANESWGGMPSAYVQSLTPTVDGFGGMMQTISSEAYAGKRVRLSGWVKTEEANQGGGHLWLRIDGEERGQMLGFDNMDNRPVKGSSDWQEASIVLDVPQNAAALAYDFFVSGGGKMWVSGQKIEEVGADVPTTNMLGSGAKRALPKAPTNLGFYPNAPK